MWVLKARKYGGVREQVWSTNIANCAKDVQLIHVNRR